MKPILATIARARLTLQREELRQQVLARTQPRHTHPPLTTHPKPSGITFLDPQK
jgi:hypothetical protein